MAELTETTPPSTGNQLIDLILGVVERNQPADELRAALTAAHQSLVSLRQETSEQYQSQTEMVAQICKHPFERVQQAIEVYQRALSTTEEYFSDHQALTLIRGSESIRRARYLLDQALMDFRNIMLTAMGPSIVPDFNLLHMHYTRWESGQTAAIGALQSVLDRFIHSCAQAGNEAWEAPDSEVRDEMVALYGKHLKGLQQARTAVSEGQLEAFKAALDGLANTFDDLRTTLPTMQVKLRSLGPTKMPVANYVLQIAMEVAAGRMGDGPLRDALAQLRENRQNLQRQLDTIARGRIDSVLVTEEADKVRQALVDQDAAMNGIERFFDLRQVPALGAACSALADAVERLHTSYETFQQIAEREGKTLCVRCQHYNENQRRNCTKCGAPLLVPAETGAVSTFQIHVGDATSNGAADIPVPDNVAHLFEAVNQVAEGQISHEEFEAVVAWMEETVETHAHSYGAIPVIKPELVPAKDRERVEQILEMTRHAEVELHEAADLYRKGLARMRRYLDDTDKAHLVEACKIIWAGTHKIHAIQESLSSLQAPQ